MRYFILISLCACRVSGVSAVCSESSECDPGLFCVAEKCAEATCSDQVKDGNETGIDCGGACPACGAGGDCTSGNDCTSRVCIAGRCATPTCLDAVKNGDETDIDCGGGCGACAAQRACKIASDCQSEICATDTCVAASCTDGVQNEDESDTDCGGSACRACTPGQKCTAAKDCDSEVCTAEACAAPTCDDQVKNGSETDTDCGGSCDEKCAVGKTCEQNGDCASDICNNGVCVDCLQASDCMRGSDSPECVSFVCANNTCQGTPKTPSQVANDCTNKVCNSDYSLTLAPAPNDHETDQNGNCYAYSCDCTATSCQKVVVFQPNDTPAQAAGDCHKEVCVEASPLPVSQNEVDDSDPPTGPVAACHSAAQCNNGSITYPVDTANVPNDNNSCTTDYCDAEGNAHHDAHSDASFCANSTTCSANITDDCGFQHNCYQEFNPCNLTNCGQKYGTGPCSESTYTCTHLCTSGYECSDNVCISSGGGSGGGSSGSTGVTRPPCCTAKPTCSPEC